MAQSRTPKGVPSGGQFSGTTRAESGTTLSGPVDTHAFVCVGTTYEGNPCLNFVTERGGECGQCAGTDRDDFGHPLGRGGYPRDDDGNPLVSLPDDPESFTPYLSASGIGVESSSTGLALWKQNQLLKAVGHDRRFAKKVQAVVGEAGAAEPYQARQMMDELRAEGHGIAETQIAAQRGTFSHWLTECHDNGVSPIEGLAKGEALGIDAETQQRIATQWRDINDDYGFEQTAVEAKIVNDDVGAAGTTDRVIRLTKPFKFNYQGEEVEIPAGTTMIGDLKTGSLKTDAKGNPKNWPKYNAQIATYAGGQLYDTQTATRLGWDSVGGPPSQEWGVIVHGDLQQIAAGESGFTVFAVNLAEGRRFVEASNRLRSAEASAADAAVNPIRRQQQ